MAETRYMISDAANLVNVESHVLRYWEEELELEIPRNELGHRYYTEDNIKEFFKIKEWKEEGYQLKAIRMLVQEEKMKRSGNQPVVSTVSPETVHKSEPDKMEQFQKMMNSMIKNAIEENVQIIGKEVGNEVGDKVIKEMNYLMRMQEEAEEERYRKLDEIIRAQKKGKRIKEEKTRKERRFGRKEKKLKPNLGV